jgi:hypothetical protein
MYVLVPTPQTLLKKHIVVGDDLDFVGWGLNGAVPKVDYVFTRRWKA